MTQSSFLKKLRTVLQWGLVVAIFIFIFKKYPAQELWKSMQGGLWVPLMLYAIAYFVFMWVVDAWGLTFFFTRYGGHPLRFLDLLRVRASSYLVQMVNYGAGQAVLAYFLSEKEEIPLKRATGFVIFLSLVDLYWIITMAFIGTFFAPPILEGTDLQSFVSPIWAAATALFIFMLLYPRFRLWSKIMEKIRFRHFLLVLLIRIPMHLVLITSFYFVPYCFHAHIPFYRILTAMPIVMFIGTLPITPGGFGTFQIAFVGFFKNFLTSTQPVNITSLLLSMSLVWTFLNYILKGLSGAFVLVFKPHRRAS